MIIVFVGFIFHVLAYQKLQHAGVVIVVDHKNLNFIPLSIAFRDLFLVQCTFIIKHNLYHSHYYIIPTSFIKNYWAGRLSPL